jgi:hypothetical protein
VNTGTFRSLDLLCVGDVGIVDPAAQARYEVRHVAVNLVEVEPDRLFTTAPIGV